jgi:predicted class III extradiol MEMO1 family dioxygenase
MRHTSYIMLSLDMFILIMLISFFSGFLTGLGAVLINTDVIEKISRRLRAELYKDPCEHSS